MSSSSSVSSTSSRVLRSRRSSVAAAASSVKTGEPTAAVSQADGKVRDWCLEKEEKEESESVR